MSKKISNLVEESVNPTPAPVSAPAASLESINPTAVRTLMDSALEKADDKIARAKRGGRELRAFASVINAGFDKIESQLLVKAALKAAMGQTSDSLSWTIQGLMQDIFWTFRRMSTLRQRTENQAQMLAQGSESSVAEVLAQLAADDSSVYWQDANEAVDAAGDPADCTIDEVEEVLMTLRELLENIYIQCSDAPHHELPLIRTGTQVATTVNAAEVLAQQVIDAGNRDRRVADRSLLQ